MGNLVDAFSLGTEITANVPTYTLGFIAAKPMIQLLFFVSGDCKIYISYDGINDNDYLDPTINDQYWVKAPQNIVGKDNINPLLGTSLGINIRQKYFFNKNTTIYYKVSDFISQSALVISGYYIKGD